MQSPSETWDKMTDEEKITFLAVKVMGWVKTQRDESIGGHWMWCNKENYGVHYAEDVIRHATGTMDCKWNPLTDWIHWWEVEEKMDERLFNEWMLELVKITVDSGKALIHILKADLPTRCKAAFLALQ